MSIHRMKRLIGGVALAALALTAAACTRAGDETGASLEQTIAVPHMPAGSRDAMALAPARVAHRAPLATLPAAAGRIVAVRVHDYVDGLKQDIALDGAAPKGMHNGLVVFARTSHQPTLDEAVPLYKPAETAIRSEIAAAFPHLPMQIVERDSANAYGPYGLALGRAGGDMRCLFMWQWIDANRLPADAGLDGPVSIRVHICQSGTSFDAMAALVDHLTIGAAPTEVVAVADEAPLPAKPHRTARRHVSRSRVAETPQPVPGEAAPTRMHYKIAPPLDPAPRVPTAAVAMAPVPLSSDLPPEALRGPQRGASRSE